LGVRETNDNEVRLAILGRIRNSVLLLLIPVYLLSGVWGPGSARSIVPLSRSKEAKISYASKGTRSTPVLVYGARRYVAPARVIPVFANTPAYTGESLACPQADETKYVVRDEPCPLSLLLVVPHPRDPPLSFSAAVS
jgi:hypothetical protein